MGKWVCHVQAVKGSSPEGNYDRPCNFSFCILNICFVCTNMDEVRFDNADSDDPEQPESETAEAHYVWQYFTVTNNTVRIQRNAGMQGLHLSLMALCSMLLIRLVLSA